MGAEQTLKEMKRLTIEAIHSQIPREAVIDIMGSGFVKDPATLVALVRRWLRIHFVIIDEFEELLTSPILMIEKIKRDGSAFGDCDDISMLGASLLCSAGILCRFAALFPQEDGSFAHVIVQYRFSYMDPWQDFDATINFIPEYPSDILTEEIIS
jgi:hypothetical protein